MDSASPNLIERVFLLVGLFPFKAIKRSRCGLWFPLTKAFPVVFLQVPSYATLPRSVKKTTVKPK
jgi:hypothetical protein